MLMKIQIGNNNMKYIKLCEQFDWTDDDFDFEEESKLSNVEYDEFIKMFSNCLENKHLRIGQCFMVALSKINRNLYDEIIGTEYDCFYDDNKVNKFLKYIKSE